MHLTAQTIAAADLEGMWARLTDIPHWQDWCPGVLRSETDGPFDVGMRARVVQRGVRATVWTVDSIDVADSSREFRWSTTGWGFGVVGEYRLAEEGQVVRAVASATTSGPMGWAVSLVWRASLRGLVTAQLATMSGSEVETQGR